MRLEPGGRRVTVRLRDFVGVVVLLVASAAAAFALGGSGKDELAAEIALLRSERLVAAVDSSGWETRVVEATASLERRLQEEADSSDALSVANAELARQAELLDGQLRTITSMYTELAESLTVDSVEVFAEEGQAPDSVQAGLDDGLLEGRVAYRFGDPDYWDGSFALDYALSIEMSQSFVELADGRLLAAAQARDPRVRLRFEDTYWSPPPPVAYCSVGQKASWAAYGGGFVAITSALFGMVR